MVLFPFHECLRALLELPANGEGQLRDKMSPVHLAFTKFVLAFILLAMIHVQAQEGTGLSWQELEKRAGYFTEDGMWRGGLPWTVRQTENTLEVCSDTRGSENGSYCQLWDIERDSDWASKISTCNCSRHTDSYCANWRCLLPSETNNVLCESLRVNGCIRPPKEDVKVCACDQAAEKGTYCQRWTCFIDDVYHRILGQGLYHCLSPDPSNTFCQRWMGEWDSVKEVQSRVCKCDQSANGYCHMYRCETRSMIRCSEHEGEWCHLETSIGLYGTLGFFFLLVGLMMHYAHPTDSRTNATVMFSFHTAIFALLLLVVVAVTGGLYGLIWVILIWLGFFLFLASTRIFSRVQRVRDSAQSMQHRNTLPPSDRVTVPSYFFHGRIYQ